MFFRLLVVQQVVYIYVVFDADHDSKFPAPLLKKPDVAHHKETLTAPVKRHGEVKHCRTISRSLTISACHVQHSLETAMFRVLAVSSKRWIAVSDLATLTLLDHAMSAGRLTVIIPHHFPPNCFRFPVLYTVYSSGLTVLYLRDSQ